MRIQALLVDDELHITKNLEQVIPWDELGIDIVGFAKNGVEALEYMGRQDIHLMLCDIRMPVMDGMELIRRLREEEHPCQVIMLTGYQDYEYTRAAIRYGVMDYLLKPIDYDELRTVVERVAGGIRAKALQSTKEQQQIGRIVGLASEKILYDILMDYSQVSKGNLILAGVEHIFQDQQYVLFVADMDHYSQRARTWDDQERKLWNFAVHNVIQDTMRKKEVNHAVIQMRDGEWCVVLEYGGGEELAGWLDETEVLSWAHELRQAVQDNAKISVSVGVYGEVLAITQLSKAYKSVQRGLQLTSQTGHATMYYAEQQEKNPMDFGMWSLIENIVSGIKKGDRTRTDDALIELNLRLQAISEQSLDRVKQILNFLVLHILREMREMQVVTKDQEEQIWKQLERNVGVRDLLASIKQLMEDSVEGFVKKKSSEVVMIHAKDYIDRNLASDLCVEELAGVLGISSSYFSLLFKQTYGETFIEYLTRQRMERAKSLLLMSGKSISKICKEVGYAERRYFTKVFQKYTGVLPSEYRASVAGQ
ncbi:response regulator transcription factor [Paenibacillus gansuensis]|uniref:Response regulator n=1 Tax=Paenibacillus gansuensis TaxID=306542 RepID=A0ABW5PKZ5_9BACL